MLLTEDPIKHESLSQLNELFSIRRVMCSELITLFRVPTTILRVPFSETTTAYHRV